MFDRKLCSEPLLYKGGVSAKQLNNSSELVSMYLSVEGRGSSVQATSAEHIGFWYQLLVSQQSPGCSSYRRLECDSSGTVTESKNKEREPRGQPVTSSSSRKSRLRCLWQFMKMLEGTLPASGLGADVSGTFVRSVMSHARQSSFT